jgi:hypothetical protein
MTLACLLIAAFFFCFYLVTMEYGYIRFEQGAKAGFVRGYNQCISDHNPTYKTGALSLEDSTT